MKADGPKVQDALFTQQKDCDGLRRLASTPSSTHMKQNETAGIGLMVVEVPKAEAS